MTVCRLRSRSKSLSLSIILFLFSCITFHISILYVLCYHFLFLPASQSFVGFIEFVSDSPTSSLDILSHLHRVHPLAPQVSVAVLLDNFITASTRMELEEKEQETVKFLRERQANNPLEPLLIKVSAQSPAGGARGQSIDVLHDLPNFKLLT